MTEPTPYPSWMDALRHQLPGETPRAHICRMVRSLNGVSLHHDADKLAGLFLANEPVLRAALIAGYKTNCATTAREFLALAGCDHPLVICEYVVGMAVSWVLRAARDMGAVLPTKRWQDVRAGYLVHYATLGANNDHVEWALSDSSANGIAVHGGGGRPDNLISVQTGSIRSSMGRPIQTVIDPDLMCLCPSTGDDPY